MKKLRIFLIILSLVSVFAVAETSSSSINWLSKGQADSLYCPIGDCGGGGGGSNNTLWTNVSGVTTSVQDDVNIKDGINFSSIGNITLTRDGGLLVSGGNMNLFSQTHIWDIMIFQDDTALGFGSGAQGTADIELTSNGTALFLREGNSPGATYDDIFFEDGNVNIETECHGCEFDICFTQDTAISPTTITEVFIKNGEVQTGLNSGPITFSEGSVSDLTVKADVTSVTGSPSAKVILYRDSTAFAAWTYDSSVTVRDNIRNQLKVPRNIAPFSINNTLSVSIIATGSGQFTTDDIFVCVGGYYDT